MKLHTRWYTETLRDFILILKLDTFASHPGNGGLVLTQRESYRGGVGTNTCPC